MKENFKKIKGVCFKKSDEEVVLKDYSKIDSPLHDQIFFTTNLDNSLCKVIELQSQVSEFKFKKQAKLHQALINHQSVAQLSYVGELQHKKKRYGLLLFNNIRKNASLAQQIPNIRQQKTVWELLDSLLNLLVVLQNNNIAYLNLSPDSVLMSSSAVPAGGGSSQYCVINFQNAIEKSIDGEQLRNNPILKDLADPNYKYVSPEILDSYSKQPIDIRSDVFALGCLLYFVCYKKYPYETPLSVINLAFSYPEPNKHVIFSKALNTLIDKCLTDYKKRPLPSQLKAFITQHFSAKKQAPAALVVTFGHRASFYQGTKSNKEKEVAPLPKCVSQKKIPDLPTPNNQTNGSSGGFFDHFKNAISKITTESEAWILSYIDDEGQEPAEKYPNLLLKKVYKNSQKLDKIYSLIHKQASNAKKQEVAIKILMLLYTFMRKGPFAIISSAYPHTLQSINNLIAKEFRHDHLIIELTRLVQMKVEFLNQNSLYFNGNFHIPRLETIKQIKLDVLKNLDRYVGNLTDGFQRIQSIRGAELYLKSLLLDDLYDAASTLVMLTICIGKDIELKLRSDNMQAHAELEMSVDERLRNITKMSKIPKLTLITCLQPAINKYKYDLDFQPLDNVKQTVFQRFYKTNIVYCNLNLPISFSSAIYNSNQIPSKTALDQSVVASTKPKSKNVLLDNDSDYQEQQAKEIASSKQVIAKPEPVLTPIDSKLQNNSKTVNNKNPFGDWFNMVGSNDSQPKQQQTNLSKDFDAIWGNNNNNNKKPNGASKNVSFDMFNFDDAPKAKPTKTAASGFEDLVVSKTNSTSASNSNDLLDFAADFNRSEPKPQVEPVAKLDMSLVFNSSSSETSQLQNLKTAINADLQDPILKDLIRSSNIVVLFKKIQLIKVIGCGSAGQVYEGVYNDQKVAVKKVKSKNQNPNAFKEFQREIRTLIKIGKHPHLVSLVGISKQKDDYYLLMDYCEGGNLFELLHRRPDITIPWKVRVSMAQQIADAVYHLHNAFQSKIIHRDLKSLNILVQQKYAQNSILESIIVKVTDFGLSRNPDGQYMTAALGTLHWMSPELLEYKNYTHKVDVYSYGVVLWEICSRETPYKEYKSPLAIMKHVTTENGRPKMTAINTGCPEQLKSLIVKCVKTLEVQRPEFSQILTALKQVTSV